ncbi:MAG: prepilin-type N-terminal cleavage/methylation domain-containing protein, partial [Candidatus Margulisbacteria bacterium]|nr:prepilin-type N-terminal cleavage/methylation domain-containing protein [Candidatus Margulisiibacteriota bacterium]
MAKVRSGFTLVELIIGLSIFALLMGTIFFTFGQELNLWDRLVSAIEGDQIGTMVISKITTDIKSADKILPGS